MSDEMKPASKINWRFLLALTLLAAIIAVIVLGAS